MDNARAFCSAETCACEQDPGPGPSSVYYHNDGCADGDAMLVVGQRDDGSVSDSPNRNVAVNGSPNAAASANAAPATRNDRPYPSPRIPRPPNAFMIFAQEFRRRTALQHPEDDNKKISTRLGQMWRSMSDSDKGAYHLKAKTAVVEHKKKYPNYVYNPREARQRRAEERKAKLMASQLKKSVGCVTVLPAVQHVAIEAAPDQQQSPTLHVSPKPGPHMLRGDADGSQLTAQAGDSSPVVLEERGSRVVVETVWPPAHLSGSSHSQRNGSFGGVPWGHSSSPSTSVSPVSFVQGPPIIASGGNVWTSSSGPSPMGPTAMSFSPDPGLGCSQPFIESFSYGPQVPAFEPVFAATRSFRPTATVTLPPIPGPDQRPIIGPGTASPATSFPTVLQKQPSMWPLSSVQSLQSPQSVYQHLTLNRAHQPSASPSLTGTLGEDEKLEQPYESRRPSALTAQHWRHMSLAGQPLRVTRHSSRHQQLHAKHSMSVVASLRHHSSASSRVAVQEAPAEGRSSDVLCSSMPAVHPRAVHIWSSEPRSYACFSQPVFKYSASMCSGSCSLPHAISLTTTGPADAVTAALPARGPDHPTLYGCNTGTRSATTGGIVSATIIREVVYPAGMSTERTFEDERESLLGSVLGCLNEPVLPQDHDQGSATVRDPEAPVTSPAGGDASYGSLEIDTEVGPRENKGTDDVSGLQDEEGSKKTVVVTSSTDCMPLKKSIMNREMNGSHSARVAVSK